METKTFEIPDHLRYENIARFEKLIRRCAKHGLPAPQVKFGDTYIRRVETEDGSVRRAFCTVGVSVEQAIAFAGWKLLARLEHDPAIGTLVHCVPGFEVPEKYRTADPTTCQHCNVRKTTRKDTFVLQHEDGTIKQIGRTCIRDFLGHDVQRLMAFCTSYGEEVEECFRSGGIGSNVTVPEDFGEIAMTVLRLEGFKPSSFDNATRSQVWSVLYPFSKAKKDYQKEILAAVTEEDGVLAREAIAYWKNFTSEHMSDFESNVKKVLSAPYFEFKHTGLAAAGFNAYLKAQGRAKALVKKAASQHVGTVGEKVEWKLTVMNRFSFETQFGLQIVNIMQDEDGNSVVWKTSTSHIENGKTYVLKGTVKRHGHYVPKANPNISIAQTELTRCKVIEEIK